MRYVTSRPDRVLRRLFTRFHVDRGATAAVEFGLIAIPFLGLVAAIIETGLVFLNGTGLEAAVQEAARKIMTGQAQGAQTANAASFLSAYLCPSSGRILPSTMSCSDMILDVRTATSFAAADTSHGFYQGTYRQQFCMGGPGQIVIVRVAYPMRVLIPVLAGLSAIAPVTAGLVGDFPNRSGLNHLLVGTAVFQNEPFPSSSYGRPASCS